jgi:hypothetical protein
LGDCGKEFKQARDQAWKDYQACELDCAKRFNVELID